jgi:hypothetical protein
MQRVEYPQERGYRMESVPLPDWMTITITEEGDSKILTVQSRIHVCKDKQVGPSYSRDFTDSEIIRELSGLISQKYL